MSIVTPTASTPGLSPGLRRLVDLLVGGVQAVAFWAAALFPLAVLLALVSGLANQHPIAFGGALALNALCAVVGHGHTPRA